VRTAVERDHGVRLLSRLEAKVHRFRQAFRAEARTNHTLGSRHSSSKTREVAVKSLKLRALPYAGALTLIASMAGYLGGR